MKELVRLFDEKPIRMIVRRGEPWWVLADVCAALGLSNPSMVADRLDDDERDTISLASGIPGNPNKTVVNEAGLYSVILRSDKPEARRFRRWVTHEVIPAIRKTGRYSLTAEARRESAAARNALTAEWHAHGADKFYHFVNLTKTSYSALYGDSTKRKEEMTREEVAALMVFESLEYLKLVKNEGIQGYRALSDSVVETAHQLAIFTAGVAGYIPPAAGASA